MGKIESVILVAVGSFIAGVLLAPKSGKETRQDIMDKTNDLKGKASDGMREMKKGAASVKDEITDGFENVKDIAKDATGDAKRTAARVKNEATARADAVKQKTQRTADNVNDTRS
ncbi:MAG: hypothetical protein JWO54_484 [Candidatus Saccharibacteria bacterium]|nr:hypothetical protein [Candidatus Saccharibacteria bacterium]MDB5180724.1 hypothetical protein [Candidatus Saccharibacteria bacterium]